MTPLKSMDPRSLAHALPAWLKRERALCDALAQAGADVTELEVLRGDQLLLGILAEEAEDPGAESSLLELKRLAAWHDERLTRLALAVQGAAS